MKRKTLKDLYLMYPHKCQNMTTNTVPLPYVPKQEIDCDSEYSLTYKEWLEIVLCYFSAVVLYLTSGFKYKLGAKLGHLQMIKVKNSRIDFVEFNKTGEKRIMKNPMWGGRYPIIKWMRRKADNGIFRYKFLWKMRPVKTAKKAYIKYFTENRTEINNLNDG